MKREPLPPATHDFRLICSACFGGVQRALQEIESVSDIQVSLCPDIAFGFTPDDIAAKRLAR